MNYHKSYLAANLWRIGVQKHAQKAQTEARQPKKVEAGRAQQDTSDTPGI